MAGELPPSPGEGPPAHPPGEPWAPSFRGRPTDGAGNGRALGVTALVLAVVAVVLAAAALILDLAHATHSAAPTTAATHTYTPAETAAAQRQLCDTYKLAARAVEVDTGGNDRALARIATTNGAVMLDNAAANLALDPTHRDAARALAAAYGTLTAMSTNIVASDAQYQAALDDITAKDSVMKSVCVNGGS